MKNKHALRRLLGMSGVALILLFAAVIAVRISQVNAAGEGLSSVVDKTTPRNQPVAITDLHITGNDNEQLSLAVHAPNGRFNLTSEEASITGVGTNEVVLTGTQQEINGALATMTYIPDADGETTITADLGNNVGNVIFNNGEGGNGHAYIIVPTLMTWDNARNASEDYTFGGKTGYLATITDQVESDFVWDHLQATGWIGASDSAVEGEWRWETGPEAGTQFWSGNFSGNPVGGQYNKWAEEEPNNSGGGEDCAQFWNEGDWNDLVCSTPRPFVVEFGDAGQPLNPIQTTFKVNGTAPFYPNAPVITSRTPAIGATGVSIRTDVSFTFDKQVQWREGSVVIYTQDDEVFQELSTTSDSIVRDGNTISLNWLDRFESCTTYSIAIESDTFYHWDGEESTDFAGTGTPSNWSFTTACQSGELPPLPNGGDGNGDGIPDATQGNVETLYNPGAGSYVTLAADPTCALSSVSIADVNTHTVKDPAYAYTSGFVNFTATGCQDGTAHVELYHHTAPGGQLTVRKYNPLTHAYFTITSATIHAAPAPLSALLVKYTIVDGGVLDVDGSQNGTIVDPVALGSLTAHAPDTGVKRKALWEL